MLNNVVLLVASLRDIGRTCSMVILTHTSKEPFFTCANSANVFTVRGRGTSLCLNYRMRTNWRMNATVFMTQASIFQIQLLSYVTDVVQLDDDDDETLFNELALMELNTQLMAFILMINFRHYPLNFCFDGYATKYISCCEMGVNFSVIIIHNKDKCRI